jgi:hypothetical protein
MTGTRTGCNHSTGDVACATSDCYDIEQTGSGMTSVQSKAPWTREYDADRLVTAAAPSLNPNEIAPATSDTRNRRRGKAAAAIEWRAGGPGEADLLQLSG